MSTTSLPLVPAARPAWTASIPRQVVLAVAGSAALAVSAHIAVPMWPVPITAQTLVVLALGFAFGPTLAASTVVLYLIEGVAGLPVFTVPPGPGALAGPTAGYLFGFVAAAALTGVLAQRGWQRNPATVAAGMVLGNLTIYLGGVGYLTTLIGFDAALSGGLYPFLIGDAVKIALAVAALPILTRRIER
ncbi:biotin transporter BioY [Euzebya sp.]|uniref:biotin transporter BioY n=1 Tax=Euzebya sp. TaxID=1971409 RepID=UPI00351502A5